MTETAQPALTEEDKALLLEFRKAQKILMHSIQKTDASLTILQKTVKATLGADQYWANEALRHIKLGMLTLYAAVDTNVTVEILNELRKRKTAMDAEAKALAEFAASEKEDGPAVAVEGL